jgi:predicted RNA binding protein YcfA (HicA-like mRNA interferase family)
VKLPRDLDGDERARLLQRYGYEVTRQKGSHLRLTTQRGGEHHLTIPRHRPLKVGALAGIVADIALHLGEDRAAVADGLFG